MTTAPGERGPVTDEDFDDDDYDTFRETGEESGVQLGTVLPLEGPLADSVLFKNVDWHEWDGGKAGGWPVWLNPRDLPAQQDMRCGECSQPLSFLVQLYCPLDHEDDAFHRCLYVFCCPKASCSKNSSVKALRCQLPRENAFYPYEPDDRAIEAAATADTQASILAKQQAGSNPGAWGVNICCVCGQLAKSACSKCRRARYCGREHQAQHWKTGGHKKDCSAIGNGDQVSPGAEAGEPAVAPKCAAGTSRAKVSASVFREFEVEVRPEPPPPPEAPDGRTAEDTLMGQMGLDGAGEDDDAAVDGEDDDSKLSQGELDKVAGVHGVKDKITLQFLTRTQTNPQVVRYDAVGAGPLWSSSNGIPTEADVPPCGRCGQTRKFEFQVMPHLLHHLGVDANAKALDAKAAVSKSQGPGASVPLVAGECMDWGTLAVYTCPDSCPSKAQRSKRGPEGAEDRNGGEPPVVGYVEEFVWRQPPP
ncbi:unnamed protein product [Pylaiella littoralis]